MFLLYVFSYFSLCPRSLFNCFTCSSIFLFYHGSIPVFLYSWLLIFPWPLQHQHILNLIFLIFFLSLLMAHYAFFQVWSCLRSQFAYSSLLQKLQKLLFYSTFGTMQSSSTTSHSFMNTSMTKNHPKNHPSTSSYSNATSWCPISSMFLCVSSSSKSDSYFLFKMLFFSPTNLCSVMLNIPILFHMTCILLLYPFLPYSLLYYHCITTLFSSWDHFHLVVLLSAVVRWQ